MALLDDVKAVVVEQLDCDPAEVKEDSKFIEDLGADSLDVVELVMALEEEYNIEIPSDDLASLDTVEEVMEFLKGLGVEA